MEPWLFLFGDGEWHHVTVRGWWLDKLGRLVTQIEWSAGGEYWTGEYRAEAEKMRET